MISWHKYTDEHCAAKEFSMDDYLAPAFCCEIRSDCKFWKCPYKFKFIKDMIMKNPLIFFTTKQRKTNHPNALRCVRERLNFKLLKIKELENF